MTKDDFAQLCAVMLQAAVDGSTVDEIVAEFSVSQADAEKAVARAAMLRQRSVRAAA